MTDLALVVDTDLASQKLIARALRELNARVLPFIDTNAVFGELASCERPTFAIIDVSLLSSQDGIELMRKLRGLREYGELPTLILSANGGSVSEMNALELGALFIQKPFRLGVFREAVRELRAEAQLRAARTTAAPKRRVLIVDDDPGIREALRDVVLDEGYEPVCAADAFEALSLCGADAPRPSLAVIDVMMPGLDGTGLATRLKATKSFASMPVVMISAFDGLEVEARRAGAVTSLKKPFDLGRFVELLHETLAQTQPAP